MDQLRLDFFLQIFFTLWWCFGIWIIVIVVFNHNCGYEYF